MLGDYKNLDITFNTATRQVIIRGLFTNFGNAVTFTLKGKDVDYKIEEIKQQIKENFPKSSIIHDNENNKLNGKKDKKKDKDPDKTLF